MLDCDCETKHDLHSICESIDYLGHFFIISRNFYDINIRHGQSDSRERDTHGN